MQVNRQLYKLSDIANGKRPHENETGFTSGHSRNFQCGSYF